MNIRKRVTRIWTMVPIALAGSCVLVLALALAGCVDGMTDGRSASTTVSTPTSDKPGSIANNHGHSVALTAADQDAGLDVALRLSGGGHGHLLYLSSEQVLAVATGGVAEAMSLVVIGHDHLVTFGAPSQSVSTNSSSSSSSASHVDKNGTISANHGHSAVLTGAAQDAGQAVTLSLTTGSGHTHLLFLSASQVKDAAAGVTVGATSTTVLGHDHIVTF